MSIYDNIHEFENIILESPFKHYLVIDKRFFAKKDNFDREMLIVTHREEVIPKERIVPVLPKKSLLIEYLPPVEYNVSVKKEIIFEKFTLWLTGTLFIGTRDITPMGNDVFNNFDKVRVVVNEKYNADFYDLHTFDNVKDLQKYVDKLRMGLEMSQ